MNRFAAEEAVSRNLSAKRGLDLDSLAPTGRSWPLRRPANCCLLCSGSETFDDIGGSKQTQVIQ